MKSFSSISLIRILLALALTTGAVASASGECIDISHTTRLTCQNFAGFYRDSDQNICTESLEFRPSNIDPSKLTATLSNEPDQNGNRGVVYQTRAGVKSFAFKPFSSYKVIGVLGEPYLAGFIPPGEVDEINFLDRNSLCKVLRDSDNETEISTNVPLQLEEGYQLDLKSIDEIGNKVYLELSKNGDVVDSKAVSPNKDDATDLDKTYYYKNQQVGNQKKLVTIMVHFKTASRGADQNMAIVDGIFQISDTPISIGAGERIGELSIESTDPNAMTITMDNRDLPITLRNNECRTLMNINNRDISVSYQFSTAQALPLFWLFIAFILIVLILAGAGAFLWTRNNLQVLPKDKSLPCDGMSTLPIKIQFVNGFGKLKPQGSDREVQMETTSGKIGNAVVPAGRAFAEVLLTSSNESGPVTVTARSDGQEVKVPIEFAANEVGLDLEIDKAEIPADGKSQAIVSIMVKCADGVHILSQSERTILLETTRGEITSPVKIPPRTMAGTATLTAGDRSGTAVITATSGPLKGEAKIVFAETEKRHCMWCGTPMEMEADKCPKCGKIPPSGVDTKQCGACNSVLPLSARFCDKCGAKQSQ